MADAKKTAEEFSYGGVVVRGDEIIVTVPVKRAADGRKVLALPKGHADGDETPEQAALREVREEAGVTADVVQEIDSVSYRYERKKRTRHKQVTFFLMNYVSGDTADHDHEMEEAYWLGFDQALKQLSYDGERDIVTKARDLVRGGSAR